MATLHQIAYPWSARCSPVEARLETLDSYLSEMELAPKVLMKIDVQGYDDRVLKGSALILQRVNYAIDRGVLSPLV
jgi:FkbM family methyltransferase